MALDQHTIAGLAEHLETCELDAKDTTKITDDFPDMDWDDAYAIQYAIRARKLARGTRIVGLKAGLTSYAKMKQMGVDTPVFGFLVDSFCVPEGGEVKMSELIHPKVEPEICFVLKHALKGPGCHIGAVLAATDGRGADVVADPVGGDVFDESGRCTAFGGRLLVLGFASGRIATMASNRPLIKGFSVVGVRAGEYGRHFPAHHAEHLAAVQRLAEAGVLHPVIGARYPLAEAKAALAAMARREVTGKIVVTIGG